MALLAHKTFSLQESFSLFDYNQNGRITPDEIAQVFQQHSIGGKMDAYRLVEIVDTNGDGTITFDEWFATLKPRRTFNSKSLQEQSQYEEKLTFEQQTLFQKAWLDQLAELFSILLQADTDLKAKRNQLQLNGERIFDEMDQHGRGTVSISAFQNWILDNCGFQISDQDLPDLETVLDGTSDYQISRDGFIETISVPADHVEGDNLGASFKASASPYKNSSLKKMQDSMSNLNNSQKNTPSKFDASAKRQRMAAI